LGLRLYLDDSASSRLLRTLLVAADHEVTIPAAVGLSSARDDIHFTYALQRGLVLITKNPEDFEVLYGPEKQHPGVLLVYRDNDVTRDMTDYEIVRAIGNVEASGLPIQGAIHTLNHWRY